MTKSYNEFFNAEQKQKNNIFEYVVSGSQVLY